MNIKLVSFLACTALSSVYANAAFAQAQSEPAAKSSEATDDSDTILVTARRREENLQEVPIAVTALSGEDLARQNVRGITDLQQSVPSLNTGNGATATAGRKALQLSLRGVRSSAVTIYSSEILRSPLTMADAMFDLESVQVLKGPQGTLFGANSLSGALLLQPARPSYEAEGLVELRAGSYGALGGTGMINIPLVTDHIALRVTGDFAKRDGFLKGPLYDYDADNHYTIRTSLLIEPVAGVKNTTVWEHYYFNEHMGNVVMRHVFPCDTTTGPLRNTTGAACVYVAPATTNAGLPTIAQAFAAEVANGNLRTNQDNPFRQRIVNNVVSNITSVDMGAPLGSFFGDLTFRSVLGYSRFHLTQEDNYGLVLDVITQNRDVPEERKTAEFQIQGDGLGGRFNWVIGAYLSRFEQFISLSSLQLSPFSSANPVTNRTNTTETQRAGYAQATLEVFKDVRFTAGYRLTRTKTKQINRNRNTAAQVCTLRPGAPGVNFPACERTDELSTLNPSYTFGLDWRFQPNSLLYFATRRGFNAGGFNPSSLNEDTRSYTPETLTDYEVGVKHDFHIGDVRIRADGALFLNDYKNMQRRNILTVVVNGAAIASPLIQNLASSRITGLEAQFDITFSRQFKARLGGSHLLEAKYTDFMLSTGGAPVDLRGNRLGQAPRWTLTGGIDYEAPEIEGVGTFGASVNAAYQSKIAFSDVHTLNAALTNDYEQNTQKGYTLLSATAKWGGVLGSNFDMSVWVKNLTDEFYYTGGSGAFGVISAFYGEPRQWGLTLSTRF